ncbi:MAG: hypothetical protein CMO30_20545 [Tistrella sp.]|nr:hypothetical protein [Tistrella sp.]
MMAGWIFAVFGLLFVGVGGFALVMMMRGKLNATAAAPVRREVVPDGEGLHLPLAAGFAGIKGLPWISWASSDIRPRLVLHPDVVEYGVVRSHRLPYAAVSRVDVRRTAGTCNFVLEFHGRLSSFAGNLVDPGKALLAVQVLAERGCPLSPRAQRLLNEAEGGCQ